MQPRFKGFNVEEPSSTRVDIPVPVGADPNRFGNIKQYKPNLIDKISGLIPDTEIGGVLKGLYRGTDDTLFGLLPSGNYESVTSETKLGEQMSFIADPLAGAKGVKYVVSGGTPISRLIANSISPQSYSNKWPQLKRVLTNPKVLKQAVIDDIPQWSSPKMDDRVFAWRKKLGLGKPNEKYNQTLDMGQYNAAQSAKKQIKYLRENHPHLDRSAYQEIVDDYNQNNPINRIWNKFGTHVEDGKTYHHYKNPDDYFEGIVGNDAHSLFGSYGKKRTMKGSKELGGVLKEDYYDNWDFAFNKPLFKKDNYNLTFNNKAGLPVILQRVLAEALLNPLEFKGTAKKIYRKPRWVTKSSERPFTKKELELADTPF
tara:strand:+ start:225 stop:1334 length:1110 start_codon:yes stop_codon:yes gene_type:complete